MCLKRCFCSITLYVQYVPDGCAPLSAAGPHDGGGAEGDFRDVGDGGGAAGRDAPSVRRRWRWRRSRRRSLRLRAPPPMRGGARSSGRGSGAWRHGPGGGGGVHRGCGTERLRTRTPRGRPGGRGTCWGFFWRGGDAGSFYRKQQGLSETY